MSQSDTEKIESPLSALSYGVGTDVGRRREENQDSYGVINTSSLKFFIVADGMGGAKGGATASSLAVKTVEQALAESDKLTCDQVAQALSRANSNIFKDGSEDEALTGMGTTLVGIAFFAEKMIVVNVGDSRAYRIRANKITQLTDDHTLVNDLVRNGAITKDQAENHPVAHMLTRSLGPCPDVDVDCFICEDGPAQGDRYLLCSDGLYNVVSSEEILKIVKTKNIDDAIPELISLANERGGPDNITIIVVHVNDTFPNKADQFKEVKYPLFEPRRLPETDAYDIRATREQYRSRVKREHDDADIRVSSAAYNRAQSGATSGVHIAPGDPSTFVHIKWAGLMILGLVMGFVLSETSSYFKGRNYTEIRTVLINPLATELAKVPVSSYKFDDPDFESGLFGIDRLMDVRGSSQSIGSYTLNQSLTKGQVEGVVERKKTVHEMLKSINEQLAALDSSNKSELIHQKETLESDIQKQETEQTKLNDQISTASKNIATWIERKQRLSSSDPVDMASEVAFTSSYVRERKDLFEKATWAYLREVEVWRFSPNDKELTQKISELGQVREQRRKELASAVEKAVDQGKLDAESVIAGLSKDLHDIEAQLNQSRSELEFFKLISAGDAKAKQAYREELKRRQALTQTEIHELERILP